MSNKYSCNKDTVIRAYKELESSHLVYSIPKSGYYVVDSESQKSLSKQQLIDFKTTLPDARLLPYKEFNHSINKAINSYKHSLFTYGEVAGLMPLRETLNELFWQSNIFTKPKNIFITSGVQQAINIFCSIAISKKQNILVEQPSYRLMQRIAEQNRNQVYGIKRDKNGIDIKELEHLFKSKDIKFFYTIPRYHNPLGSSYSEKQKQQIVDLAKKHDVYILEDDYLGDLAENSKNQTLYSYDNNDKVIYLKSFSKSFMPGIRIGVAIIPKQLQAKFTRLKRYDDINTSILAQGGLDIFIKNGMYYNHLKKIRAEYKSKMSYAISCLSQGLKNVNIIEADTGFFIWVSLPKEINVNKLELRLLNKKVLITPAKGFYLNQKTKENSFRLCISALSKQQIRYGILTIISEIKQMNR